jgi:hypothetical protein
VLRKILVGLGVAVVVFVGVGLLLPRTVHVERTAKIERPPSVVFALVNSFRRFDEWSPWGALDPAVAVTRSGPEVGVGASYAWKGNSKVGTGRQTIVEAAPNTRVRTALEFDGAPATAEFRLVPAGGGTAITWTLDIDMGAGPVGRWIGLAMDRMVGRDYERGLAALKTVAERLPAVDLAGLAVTRVADAPRPDGATGPALKVAYEGPADGVASERDRLVAWAQAYGYPLAGPPSVVPTAGTTRVELYAPLAP